MADNSRVTGVAAFLAAGLLGGGVALPTLAAAEPAVTGAPNSVAERLAGVRASAALCRDSIPLAGKPDPDPPFSDTFVKHFGDTLKPC